MRISLNASSLLGSGDVGALKDHAAQSADEGFSGWWLAQTGLIDALTVFTAMDGKHPSLELGTAVIPTYPRHPTMLAGQALTTQAVMGEQPLVLGIGLSHQPVVEGMLGMSFDKPIRHLIDYLSILNPLLEEGAVEYKGEAFTTYMNTSRPSQAPSVMVAALGEQSLRVAGHRCDGTILWMTGPKTIASHIAPTINAAAAEAGRPAPRIVCSLPICVTDNESEAREDLSKMFAMYGQLQSYRAMLDREGVDQPGEVAIVGDEEQVMSQLDALSAAGTTDFAALEIGRNADESARTHSLLLSRL